MCPNILLTDSIGMPLLKVTVVAKVITENSVSFATAAGWFLYFEISWTACGNKGTFTKVFVCSVLFSDEFF